MTQILRECFPNMIEMLNVAAAVEMLTWGITEASIREVGAGPNPRSVLLSCKTKGCLASDRRRRYLDFLMYYGCDNVKRNLAAWSTRIQCENRPLGNANLISVPQSLNSTFFEPQFTFLVDP